MFFSLFYHSTIIKENKVFYSILYGSILYLVIHAIMSFSDSEIIDTLKNNYFWTIFYLDLGSFLFFLYNGTILEGGNNGESTDSSTNGNTNDVKVTINTLKNKINQILKPEGSIHMSSQEPITSFNVNPKQDLKVPSQSNISFQNNNRSSESNSQSNQQSNSQSYEDINKSLNALSETNNTNNSQFSMSTPINQLHKQLKPQLPQMNQMNQMNQSSFEPKSDMNQSSTKIADLRDRLAHQTQMMKPEGITRIGGDDSKQHTDMGQSSNGPTDIQSIAGSDVGSVLDLDLNDFENSIN